MLAILVEELLGSNILLQSHGVYALIRLLQSHIASMKTGLPGGMGLRIDCDQCSFTANSSQQMLKHKQARHEGVVRRVGKLSCPYCDYRNSYQKVMALHIKAHEGKVCTV